jgi:hypothetical protein
VVSLALKLLQNSVEVVSSSALEQQPGADKQQRDDRPEADAELQRLAYCSLASSVMQACLHDKQLGAWFASEVMDLAVVLGNTMIDEFRAARSSSSSNNNNNNNGHDTNPTTTSTISSSENSNHAQGAHGDGRQSQWGFVASLSAAVTAGAYTVHLNTCAEQDTPPDAGCSHAPGCSTCPPDCGWCCCATQLYVTQAALERGLGHVLKQGPELEAALAKAAKSRGLTKQQLLQRELLGQAWRHPVPHVCGNPLCQQLWGRSAVAAVKGPGAILCDGCKAAWYCSQGCQRAAQAAHKGLCGASS